MTAHNHKTRVEGCVICGTRFFPPAGALCDLHEQVTRTFTPKMWKRVEAMTSEKANEFLRKREAQLRARGWEPRP